MPVLLYSSGKMNLCLETIRYVCLFNLKSVRVGAYMIQILQELKPASLKIERTGGIAS